MKPFIYIGGLFRSGTTLVQELLTEKEKSFIFHEPRFGDGWWQFQELDRKFLKSWEVTPLDFKLHSIPELVSWFSRQGYQVGVKEIRNGGWPYYADRYKDNLKLIIVERDPADIYISCYKMIMRNSPDFQWRPHYLPFNAINIYRELKPEIDHLNEFWNSLPKRNKMVIQYRNICAGETEPIYTFTESDVVNPSVGKYHEILARGGYEMNLHKGNITKNSLRYDGHENTTVEKEARKLVKLFKGQKLWI